MHTANSIQFSQEQYHKALVISKYSRSILNVFVIFTKMSNKKNAKYASTHLKFHQK